ILGTAKAAVAQCFDHFETLGQIALFLAGRFLFLANLRELVAKLLGKIDQIESFQKLLDGLRAHVGLEAFAVTLPRFAKIFFGQELTFFERRLAGFDDHIILEINDLFQARRFHVKQGPQPAGHSLEEPDVDHGGRQFDVAHALTAYTAIRHINAAAVADHSLVLHATVLAARAFPVLFRAEYSLEEYSIIFG